MKERTEQIGTDIGRLMKLRDIAIPFARKKHQEGKLNFSLFMCGTEGCLLGWMVTLRQFRADGWRCPGSPSWGAHGHFGAAAAYFGIRYEQARDIFGPTMLPLEGRAKMVDMLIQDKLEDQA